MTLDENDDTSAFDAQRRRLCPDGNCIGLQDDGGRCKVCGKTYEGGAAPSSASSTEAWATEDLDAADEGVPFVGQESTFDPARRLCPDGTCIGLLEIDGRCKVCGSREDR